MRPALLESTELVLKMPTREHNEEHVPDLCLGEWKMAIGKNTDL
jgi:hypothetical protein